MGAGEEGASESLDFIAFFEELLNALHSFDLGYIGDIAWPVLWPMIVGGAPCFIIAWPLFYYPVKIMVKKYHERRVAKCAAVKDSKFESHSND